jgi:hypothetical protein
MYNARGEFLPIVPSATLSIPVDKEKVKANGTNAYEFPTTTSQKIGVAGGTNVGKVRAVSYNQDALWFYLPDNGGNYKWGLANYFVKA